jgi:para-aminobenzoate synthetase component 1
MNQPVILGANYSEIEANRFSFFSFAPRQTIIVDQNEKDPFKKLADSIQSYTLRDKEDSSNQPPAIGWVGYFSYDLGRFIENIPQIATDDLKLPLIWLGFYDKMICYDRKLNTWCFSAVQVGSDDTDINRKFKELETIIEQAADLPDNTINAKPITKIDVSHLGRNMDRDYYFDALDKTKKHIKDGEVYQINLSQRFHLPFNSCPEDLFIWQYRYNPSPYSAYIDTGKFQIVSASPEMFIDINDGTITTKPIKGTRARVAEESAAAGQLNLLRIKELTECEKEKAELNMIIDLERNDITRVCQFGTIKVAQKRMIEAFPTVFHAAASIQGRLRKDFNGQTFCEILKAVFPGGSITGAPKIRAMEIIEKLEPTRRSVYTGSIGYIALNNKASLNISIRTIIISDKLAYAQTGGGIVYDSNPELEWQETLIKAKALVAGIKAVNEKG